MLSEEQFKKVCNNKVVFNATSHIVLETLFHKF